MEQSYVNGKRIEHLDVIMHNVEGVKLDFVSRLKILFGFSFSVNTRIYTMHQHCNTVAGETSFSIKDAKITSEKIKEVYQKWHNSLYRLVLAFVSTIYCGYLLLFVGPEKYTLFLKLLGVVFVLWAIDFAMQLRIKYLLKTISKHK